MILTTKATDYLSARDKPDWGSRAVIAGNNQNWRLYLFDDDRLLIKDLVDGLRQERFER